MNKKLLDILACPLCKGPLHYQEKRQVLVCKAERLSYPIRDGFPMLLESEAARLNSTELEALLEER